MEHLNKPLNKFNMKKYLFLLPQTILFILILQTSHAQNPTDILEKALEKCESINHGFYVMTEKMKYFSNPDTNSHQFAGHFKRMEKDTLFGFMFRTSLWPIDSVKWLEFYSGGELVRANLMDSTATITSVAQWAEHISNIAHNIEFYDPLTKPGDSHLPEREELKNKDHTFSMMADEIIHEVPCFHIKMLTKPDEELGGMGKFLRIQHDYWISKVDNLPMQYGASYDMVMEKDTMYQYSVITLDSLSLHEPDSTVFSLTSLPGYFKLKEYTQSKRAEVLTNGTMAPGWKWPSLTNDSISLADLNGKLVLIDFFYKSCFPCMQALPGLQSLHEKYQSKGLHVVGVNPYDKDPDDLAKFLKKRNVSYPVILTDKKFPETYNVSGYPTMYLVDQNGVIIHAQVGYGEGTEKKLEKIIRQHL